MAAITLISKKKSTTGSPYAYYTFTAEEVSRTSTAISIKLTVTGWLQYSSSTFGTGLGLSAGVYIGGAWRNWTLKSTSSAWSGTTKHTQSTTVSIPVSQSTTAFTGIQVRVRRTDSNGSSCKLSATTATTSTMSIATSAKFTISYDANGGTGAPAAQTKSYGVNIKLSSTEPTRASETDDDGAIIKYTFAGWTKTKGSSVVDYLPSATYSTNASVTLYAVWSQIDGYLIFYDTQGGSNILTQSKPAGESVNITSEIPILYGHTFMGWSTSSEGTTPNYQAGDAYSTDSHLYLYAIWNPWVHTVQFDANGGTGAPSGFIKTVGVNQTIPETVPDRAGYIFLGWSTQSNTNIATYNAEDTYIVEQDGGVVTLYAVWLSTDVFIYTNGCCRAIGFEEGANCLSFVNGGTIKGVEFIETRDGSVLNINGTAFYITEILEQHSLHKLTDESGGTLLDESGNRLYYIQ